MRKKVMEEVSRRFCDICGEVTNKVDIEGRDYCEKHYPEQIKIAKEKVMCMILGATIAGVEFSQNWEFSEFSHIIIRLQDGTTLKVVNNGYPSLYLKNLDGVSVSYTPGGIVAEVRGQVIS